MAVQFDQNLYNVGQRIREIRIRKGISQTELALTMGTTKTAVSYWENGERALRLDNFFKLARALDVPAAMFLKEEDEKFMEEDSLFQAVSGLPKEEKTLILQAVRMMVVGAKTQNSA